MKAWVLKRLGGPLELVDLPEPEAEEGEVVLRVEAVGLNFADHLMRLGAYLTRLHPPFIPGMEVVGVVEGRRYAALVPQGGLAERVAVPKGALLPLPEGLSPEEAAAFPVSFLTAYLALKRAQARPGEKVLVQAAAGALGTAAVQVARAMGLRVLAAASGPRSSPSPRPGGRGGRDLRRGAGKGQGLGRAGPGAGGAGQGGGGKPRPPRPRGRLVYIGAAEGRWPPSRPSASCAATWPSSASGSPPPAGGRPGGGGPGLPPPQARAGA